MNESQAERLKKIEDTQTGRELMKVRRLQHEKQEAKELSEKTWPSILLSFTFIDSLRGFLDAARLEQKRQRDLVKIALTFQRRVRMKPKFLRKSRYKFLRAVEVSGLCGQL